MDAFIFSLEICSCDVMFCFRYIIEFFVQRAHELLLLLRVLDHGALTMEDATRSIQCNERQNVSIHSFDRSFIPLTDKIHYHSSRVLLLLFLVRSLARRKALGGARHRSITESPPLIHAPWVRAVYIRRRRSIEKSFHHITHPISHFPSYTGCNEIGSFTRYLTGCVATTRDVAAFVKKIHFASLCKIQSVPSIL